MSGGGWTALITTGCFCVLASFAYGRAAPHQHQGYDLRDIAALNEIAATPVKLWKKPKVTHREQAKAYALVYGITDDNINSYKEWW